MNFVGIESVLFATQDLTLARRLLRDWGLSKIRDTGTGVIFETGNGAQVVVRRDTAKGLPPPLSGGSKFRQFVLGVRSQRELDDLGAELARDRAVSVAADGTLATTDDSGINIGFRLWHHGKRRTPSATQWNAPGRRLRVDRESPRYPGARPYQMGHIVFSVPDTRSAESFYRKRLGFWLTDRYVGGAGVFLRWAESSEHHNLFLLKSRTGKTDLHHIAFEVRDVHEVFGGGREFAKRGWATEVGPGRHPISSAYFWYFKNPLGGAIEYFCDPDYVSARWKPNNYRVNRFSEWHLPDGIAQKDDGRLRPSLAAVKQLEATQTQPAQAGAATSTVE
jgi:catechol 2,3-dioxygenase-like lactoylglutathione lyase family enzyme